MENEKVYAMPLSKVYPLLVGKALRKGRSQSEVDDLIFWLTGYDEAGLRACLDANMSYRDFFNEAPSFNADADKIRGVICGIRVEEIADPLMKKIRQLDKLIDELAKGKDLEKIKRK